MRKTIVSALAILASATTANAATIKVKTDGAVSVVALSGSIGFGDAAKFVARTKRLTGPVTVILEGPGGSLDDGLAIGERVRRSGWNTATLAKSMCASACALAWLGGTTRYVHVTSGIGFHTAFTLNGKRSAQGNAAIKRYMVGLGLDASAATQLTKPGPDSMVWLTPALADRHAIACEVTGK